MTIKELRKRFISGELTPLEYMEELLETIRQKERKINAFTHLEKTDTLLKEAELWTEKYKSGEELPPLAGIPVAIKDNIAVKDMPLTCASKILQEFTSPYDATAVRKLKEAGAIIIGKTNLDEFAMGSTTEFSIFGPTHNPVDLERVPGGSSGGSAASVAAGMVPVALGSDTGGSVRQPASFTDTVGIKPSYGMVSRYGLVAFASSLDQIGVLAKNVEDASLIIRVIAGKDKYDATSRELSVKNIFDAFETIDGVKIGVWKELDNHPAEDGVMKVWDDAIMKASKEFQMIPVSLPDIASGIASYYLIAPAEASANLARYDGVRYAWRVLDASTYKEMVKRTRTIGFGKEVKRRIMIGTFALSAGYQDAFYKKAVAMRYRIMQNFEEAFKQVDVILVPTSPKLPWKIGQKMSPSEVYKADLYTIPVNLAGLPAVSIPAGYVDNLPVGIQVIGKYGEDEKVWAVADKLMGLWR
ncbi:Asp-tRNA(Asn)/Glu-tRNA(Gln) amidotransferase subunit GatA [bacterium 3DAC]|nr:Asp-tRNA(Asn)/Glu-tRNA(Gln) amidotransferase subunit GatA [Dictyoglomota bacterium]UZN22892.1 Asp-tRNA(Asn)/Glu-tRNA(Gln) amidotransferase subunit GatA [bacterium 3DAC]